MVMATIIKQEKKIKKTVKTKITIIDGKNLTNLNSSDIFLIQQLNKG